MTSTLDFRSPLLVIVGHWNGAILNEPGWIARHILDVPEGQNVNLQAMLVSSGNNAVQIVPDKQIWIFDTFGMSCFGQRLEFFTKDVEQLDDLYRAARRVFEKLPHTPKSALGVNFTVSVRDDLALVTPRFDTDELFFEWGTVRSLDRTDSIELSQDHLPVLPNLGKHPVQLNISRRTDFSSAEISFNYHSAILSEDFLLKWIEGAPIDHWRTLTEKLAGELYDVAELERSYL